MRKSYFILLFAITGLINTASAQSPTDEIQGDPATVPAAPAAAPAANTKTKKHKPLLTVQGAVYSSLPYFRDDNPAGYTQTYLRINFQRPCFFDHNKHVGYNKRDLTEAEKHFSFDRNFFVQVLYSTNADKLPAYINSANSADSVRYVNRLDLLKHSSLTICMLDNILTYNSYNSYRDDWRSKVYLDAMATFMRTVVSDSPVSNDINVSSLLFGGNLKAIFTNVRNFTHKPITIEVSGQVFWVNSLSNSVNSDLNFQYENKGDYQSQLNRKKGLVSDPYPYYKVDFLSTLSLKNSSKSTKATNGDAGTGTNKVKSDDAGSRLFIHLGYTSNFGNFNKSTFFNNYFQAQVGVSIDISKAIQSMAPADVDTHASNTKLYPGQLA